MATRAGTRILARWTGELIWLTATDAGERAALFERAGLKPGELKLPDTHIDHRAACELWELLGPRLEGAAASTRFAERLPMGTLGLLGYVAASSATLGAAIERVVRYHSLVKPEGSVILVERGGMTSVIEMPPPGQRPFPRHLAEAIVGAYVALGAVLTGKNVAPAAVEFCHRRTPDAREVERALRCTVAWSRPVNRVAFTRAVLDLPLVTRDDTLLGYLEPLAVARSTTTPWLESLRLDLARSFAATPGPTLAGCARRVAMSERSLQRRLAERGLTFRTLADEVRRDLVHRLLSDPQLHRSEVAYLTGFKDSSALRKAIKRWTPPRP